MSYIAPAGTPLSLSDLVLGLGAGLRPRDSSEQLAALLAAHSGQPQCWLVRSGRTSMTILFEAMKRVAGPRRDEVVVPGYTCYSVAAAVERAGLKVRICDIDPQTLSPDLHQLQQLDFSSVLCIVSANLYGIPNALTEIEALAKDRGVFLLDDAAQSLGARYQGRAVGGFGDAGLYSFDKGKNITTIQGGAIVARGDALRRAIDELVRALPEPSFADTTGDAVKLAAYWLLLRPTLYGITQRMPFLGLGRTPYETIYPMSRYSGLLAGMALRLARRLDKINSARVGNARALHAALQGLPGVRLIDPPAQAASVYTRLPVFVADMQRRQRLIERLNAAGIGATRSYPFAIHDIPELAGRLAPTQIDRPAARAVAESIFTLPTHGYCPPDLGARVRTIFEQTSR